MVKDITQPATQRQIAVGDIRKTHTNELDEIARYRRLTNYLVVAQIYLRDNVLLQEPLKPEHIKDRLLGHWGTSPGINLVYAHLNRLIKQNNLDMFLVTGPGHGAPANLANLYLEGTLNKYYPALTFDKKGLHTFVRNFSWPGGFPSHLYPGVPGTIHEGGELGYALATAFGAAMDNPDLVVACIVGDGEAETGPTATAWHSYKFINPVESGAVLPILHLNGYKISNPTIYGTMEDDELLSLFTGYGYKVQFVEGGEDADLDAQLYGAMDWGYQEIRAIQQAARSGQRIEKPKWPLIILRTPKGMTAPAEMDGEPLVGSYRSHQVPITDPQSNPEHLKLLEQWLRSYRVEELIDEQGRPRQELLNLCPIGDQRMGSNPHTYGGKIARDLDLPPIQDFAAQEDRGMPTRRGGNNVSAMEQVALYLREVIKRNPHLFRIFSPDELQSNKLGAVLDVKPREYEWPVPPHNEKVAAQGGQVIEVLSEHDCEAWLQGYILTGRHGLFPSYEAFLNIIVSMTDQFAKFLKLSKEFAWRLPVPSLNYLETSTLWRQEHNGFSHQNPGFINSILNKKAAVARVYLPPDANCLVSTMDHCLQSEDKVNLVIANKQRMPQWLSMDEAIAHCRAGASIWPWASTDNGVDPDIVLVGIGDNTTLEVMAAAQILRDELPELRIRVVNVTDLFILQENTEHPHGLDQQMFEALFTPDRPVIINFHGYPSAVEQLLFGRPNLGRISINGYREEGTTTTPFDMNVRNGTSRYQIVIQAIRKAAAHNPKVAALANARVSDYEYRLEAHRKYIEDHGSDPREIVEWQWQA
ncbi:putative phosphoketolase [Dictyobacter alpinus]|uniref:Putative phosphoketolase n=1 Tax=Dictyobacter alpinus TaxID=2014873 RepID=A0A402BG63_9CHLR|nr:phosphoketolase family protein [Dictyobacter alpinus]GCE30257.1 putative phosphoketolase [Dictyobacter alpinus]